MPTPAPPSACAWEASVRMSWMESSSSRYNPSVPSPLTSFTVTVWTAPDPDTVRALAVTEPEPAASKSVASTPATGSLNRT